MAPETENVDGESTQKTVFIDTSLDTHLATIVSDSDTVSDLKKKVMLEHRQCFPTIGDIKINCLKMKQRGNYYHMADSMLLKSVFSTIKTNWFVSVDASLLNQDVTIQPSDKHKAGNQLALPWVTDGRSSDRHGNHKSPSGHPKMVPAVNQKSPSVKLTFGDSCKDVSKNLEEDKSSNDKQLDSKVLKKMHTENSDIKSKKRRHSVDNKSSLKGALGSGLSVKKKRKTLKGEENVKASEDKLSIFDTDKGINKEDTIEHKSHLSDESTRIKQGENSNSLNQLDVVAPSQDVGEETNSRKVAEISETVPDVATPVEQTIQQEMPLEISQEKDIELVQNTSVGNELPSSLRTSDSERDAPGITPMSKPEGSERSTEHKATEKESPATSFINNLNNINKDVIDSSQQDVGSFVQESAGDQIDKEKQGPEVNLPKKRRRVKKSAAKNKRESLAERADKEISSIVLAPVFDEKVIDERNEISEKTVLDDSKKGDEMIVEEVEIPQPTSESLKSQEYVENVEKNSKTVLKDSVSGRKKKKNVEKSAARNDESVVKQTSDAAALTSEEMVLPQSERKESLVITSTDADQSRNEKKSASRNNVSAIKHDAATVTNEEVVLSQFERKESSEITLTDVELSNASQVNAEGINCNVEKQNDTIDNEKQGPEVTLPKKRRRAKKSAAKSKDESLVERVDNLGADKKISSIILAPVFDEKVIDERKEIFEKTVLDESKKGDGEISEPTEILKSQVHVESVEENSETVLNDSVSGRQKKEDVEKFSSRNDESVLKQISDIATVTNEETVLPRSERKESLVITSTDADQSKNEKNVSQVIAGVIGNLEKQNDSVRRRKKKKSASRNNEFVMEHRSDAATVINEEVVLSQSERKESTEITLTDAELSNVSQVNTEGINGNSEKQDDTIDKEKQGPEVKLSAKRKRAKKTATKNREKSLVERADNLVVSKDISSIVLATAFDEKVIGERNEISEETELDDSKKGDEMIVKEVDISERNESLKSQVHVESVEENSRIVLKDSVVNQPSDAATVTNEEMFKESLVITPTDTDQLNTERKM